MSQHTIRKRRLNIVRSRQQLVWLSRKLIRLNRWSNTRTGHLFGGVILYYSRLRCWLVARFNARPRLFAASTALLGGLILAGLGFLVYYQFFAPSYQLTSADAKLIGSADTALMKSGKFAYNTHAKAYYLNKSDLNSSADTFNSEAVTVGNSSATASYALKLPTTLTQGVTVRDNTSGLSLSLIPQFSAAAGKNLNSHIVYPLTSTSGAEDIYTVKQNGLQEDVVLNQPTSSLKLTYKLSLPNYLAAKSLSDGAVGIYSADPALFGNISYGSSADQLAVAKARANGQKNYLVFALLPPVIRDNQTITANSTSNSNGSDSSTTNPPGTKTSLTLKGNTLTLVATNLSRLPSKAYPLDIDPSILVASANSFSATGNNESDLTIGTSSISEAGLTGGTLAGSTWLTATAVLPVATQNSSSVVYNGYVYEIGGANSGGTALQTVEYAQLNSNGSLNNVGVSCPTGWPIDSSSTWCVNTTGLPAITTASNATVYNGYLYSIGGHGGGPLATVEYAQPSSSGVLSTMTSCPSGWTLSTNDYWCYDTSSLQTADQNGALAVYNNYVYVIGGYNGGALQTVEYAQFGAVGALATLSSCASGWTLSTSNQWCYNSTSLPAASQTNAAAAYNGYLYEIGGVNSSALTTVDYTAINSTNGSPGTWADAGNDLLVATRSSSSIVYNGYLYEIGGYVSGAASTNVEYAPLYANGTDGAWNYTSALPAANYTASAVQYNGNLIQLGGENTSSTVVPTIYTVAIEPAGYLSTNWNSLTPFTTTSMPARNGFGAVAYNGYLYVMGGIASASTGDCTTGGDYCNGVFYDSISSSGALGVSWTKDSAATFPSSSPNMPARSDFSAVAYDGYMYVMGGQANASGGDCTTTSDDCNGVFYDSISSTGALGTAWTSTAAFSSTSSGTMPARLGLSAVAYNGYLYVMGGQTDASGVECATTNDFCNGVWYDSIGSTGALGSTWTPTTFFSSTSSGTMPARAFFGAVTNNGYLYVMGGQADASAGDCTTGGDYCNGVWYDSIGSTGALGSAWTSTTPFSSSSPTMPARSDFGTIVYNGYLYVVSGKANASGGDCTATYNFCNGVFYAPLNSNGTIGSWASTTTFTTTSMPARDDFGTVVYNGYLYVLGGKASASTGDCTATYNYCNGVFDSPINNGGSGTVGSWTDVGHDLPTGTYSATSVAYNGYLYELGGYTSSTTVNTVLYAPINANGTLGAWTTDTAGHLYVVTHGSTSVAYNGYIYEIGGEDNSSNAYATVAYAQIGTAGALNSSLVSCPSGWTLRVNTWCQSDSSLETTTKLGNAVVYNGYIYEIGGSSSSALTTVEYTQIGANGTVAIPLAGCASGWTAASPSNQWCYKTTSLPTATYRSTSVVYNGYIYEIGGYNGTSYFSTVDYAPINGDGSVGSWTATTSLPLATDYGISAAYDGYLYFMGGQAASSTGDCTAAGNTCIGTIYAPINSNGTLGPWTATTNLANAAYVPTTTAYNGYIYEIGGGYGSTLAELANIDYASLSSIPRVGDYSDLINLASSITNPSGNVDPIEIVTNGTNTGNPGIGGLSGPGGITTQYAIADNTCSTLSAPQTLGTIVSNQLGVAFKFAITTNGCSTATNLGSYLWLRYILDDSQTATFPDVNGNHTTINNFTVYYHPNQTYRLRGGATFNNGSLQSLDTAP